MKFLLLLLMVKVVAMTQEPAPAANQIVNFKNRTNGPIGVMRTSAGAPIEYKDATNTLNRRLLFDEYFMDSLTHHVRDIITERIVHSKAAGAFGYFKVTHDFTDICKADLFSAVGKKTPVAARFSPAIGERGTSDTVRAARGFAVKFYTEEGNFDIVGFNLPIFFFKDPLLFTGFSKAQRRNPATNLVDGNQFWDVLTLNPEAIFMFLYVFSDRGVPDGYRYMPGFSIHTYEVVNKYGDKSYIRFYFEPDAGIRNIRSDQATKLSGIDPDYATKDLYNAIARGNCPSWTVKVQVLSPEDIKNANFDVFDVTKELPLDKYPPRPLGKFVLNKNAVNYFAEIEQLAFSPSNLVPGMNGAPDKIFEARRLIYRDAQYYRLGVNFNRIAVNCPFQVKKLLTYNRDGRAPVRNNGGGSPAYYPNSFNGPLPYKGDKGTELIEIYQNNTDNFEQASEFYANKVTEERSRLVENLLYSLGPVTPMLQKRAVKILKKINQDLGNRVQKGLQSNRTAYSACEKKLIEH